MRLVLAKLACAMSILTIDIAKAHYLFRTLVTENGVSYDAHREPQGSQETATYPIMTDETYSSYGDGKFIWDDVMRCNKNTLPAKEIITVNAGSTISFNVRTEVWEPRPDAYTIWHPGPGSLYLGKAPNDDVHSWDGSGPNWFKISESGATSRFPTMSPYNMLPFPSYNAPGLNATIPPNTPSGEYLLRAEHVMVIWGPQFYVGCAEIRVVNGGDGQPEMFSIPGHIKPEDHVLGLNYFMEQPEIPLAPGPRPWMG